MLRKLTSVYFVLAAFLLAMQIGGAHLHVDEQGKDQHVHSTHVHESEPDSTGHESEIDLSLLEWGNSTNKPSWFLTLLPVMFVAAGAPKRQHLNPVQRAFRILRSSRWRPPLRAPPSLY